MDFEEKRITKEFLDTIFNEIERTELERFLENRTMVEAVKKAILAGVYFNGTLTQGQPADPRRNFLLSAPRELTNELLGEHLKASVRGVNLIEKGFEGLELYKKVDKPTKVKTNEAE